MCVCERERERENAVQKTGKEVNLSKQGYCFINADDTDNNNNNNSDNKIMTFLYLCPVNKDEELIVLVFLSAQKHQDQDIILPMKPL